ncbi:MAG TPA: hypothetical protein VMI06_17110, partial [Terriglobia bacterium]|nr:hypothetical protein [Terriglobia bacterium]
MWPALAATSWFWITATNPTTLFDPPANLSSPSGESRSLISPERRQRVMNEIERHRKAGRRLADSRHGVVSRAHLVPAALRLLPGNPQAASQNNGKLGPGDPPTWYTYDALDNLIQVQQQGGTTDSSQWRTRTFVYDSLSRLISATNPESGTTSYSYDGDGNLVSKTDARGITVTYSYDALNRLIQKAYSDGEPTVAYGYDGVAGIQNCPPAFGPGDPVGNRTSMCDAAGTETWG